MVSYLAFSPLKGFAMVAWGNNPCDPRAKAVLIGTSRPRVLRSVVLQAVGL